MKKYGLLIVVLVACVFSSMVSESTAIYTHSDNYNLTFNFVKNPIITGDLLKYHMSGTRRCDYNKPTSNNDVVGNYERDCEQGSAEYDEIANKISLFQDAGFFKNYKDSDVAYLVNGSFTYNNTESPKNFGMYFNGSYNQQTNVDNGIMMQSNGYVLLFDKDGNLVINEQGIANYQNIDDHTLDVTRTSVTNPIRNIPVATNNDIVKFLNGTSSIDIQVRVSKNDTDRIIAYVYINGNHVNENPIVLGFDLRKFNSNGLLYDDCMIGASTYGLGTSVIVTHMSKEVWDGSSL